MVTTCTNTSSSQSDKAVKSRHRSDVDETSVISQEQPQKFEQELDFEEHSSIIEENSTAV